LSLKIVFDLKTEILKFIRFYNTQHENLRRREEKTIPYKDLW